MDEIALDGFRMGENLSLDDDAQDIEGFLGGLDGGRYMEAG
jgi:hypothetical protein